MIRTKQAQKSKKLLLLGGIVILVLSAVAAVRLYLDYQMRVWDYPGNLIMLNSESLSVLVYSTTSGTKKQVILPSDAFVTVPGGYGQYQLKHIVALSRSEGKDDQLLKDAVSDVLGIPIDATHDSLTIWDRLLINRIEENGADTQVINLSDFPLFVSETRADGVITDRIDPLKVDFYLKDIFWEHGIKDENLAVGVFNASGRAGIATRTTRILEHIGVRVVDVSNWEEELTTCELRIHPSIRQSITFFRIQQHFNCQVRETISSDRFDMQVIVVD